MMNPKEFLLKVIRDHELFTALYIHTEEKVLRVTSKGDDFSVGLLMGFWLGRMYEKAECDRNTSISKNGDGK